MVYIVEVDHLLDVEREETGIRAIYSHYPILFGLSLITIALSFFGNGDMNAPYTVFYFYGGLVLFMLGLLQHNAYNKQGRTLSKQFHITQLLLISIGFGISLLVFSQSWSWLIVTSLIVTSL
ncbi:low temperature requirement protein A, partial [Streptococcus suis]